MRIDGALEKAGFEVLTDTTEGTATMFEGKVWWNSDHNVYKIYLNGAIRTCVDNRLIGSAANEIDMGDFTGSTITSDQSVKECLQDLETSLESKEGNFAGDSNVGVQSTSSSDWTDFASVSLTTYGSPVKIVWSSHIVPQNNTGRLYWRLAIDGSGTLTSHNAYFGLSDNSAGYLITGIPGGVKPSGYAFPVPTWFLQTATSHEVELYSSSTPYSGTSAPPTDNWYAWIGEIPMYNLSAGSHTFKLQFKSEFGTRTAYARDTDLRVTRL